MACDAPATTAAICAVETAGILAEGCRQLWRAAGGFFLAFLLAAECSQATPRQGASTAAGRDVASIARAIEAHYQATTTLKATFLQRRSEGKRAIEIESGTVYFRRPRRMRWEYESPETKLFLADGKFVWFYVPADHTVSRAKMKESDDARVPLVLLAGQARLGRVCRRVELADIHVLTAGNVALRCLPKANQSDFRAAILEVDSGYRLVRILVSEAGDVETEFRFANWQENLPVSQNLFRFQPPAGVSIVDDSSARSPAP